MSENPNDLAERIASDHRALDEELAQFDWIAAEERAARFTEAVNMLLHHEIAEQLAIYPAVGHLMQGHPVADDAVNQERVIEQDLSAVGLLDPASETFRLALRVLRQSLRLRTAHEEAQVLPVLLAAADHDAVSEVARRYGEVVDAPVQEPWTGLPGDAASGEGWVAVLAARIRTAASVTAS